MGNCFSDPSAKKGKGQVLGSGPSNPTTTTNPNITTGSTAGKGRNTNYQGSSPAALGGSTGEQGSERERALAAAEERAKAVSLRAVARVPSHYPFTRNPESSALPLIIEFKYRAEERK